MFCSVDPFSKKDWYDVKAPAMFNIRNLGKTLVTRTQGTSKYLLNIYIYTACVCLTSVSRVLMFSGVWFWHGSFGKYSGIICRLWEKVMTAVSVPNECHWLLLSEITWCSPSMCWSSPVLVSIFSNYFLKQESPLMGWRVVCSRWASLTCRTMRSLSASSS